MLNAALSHRVIVACPVCKVDDYRKLVRSAAASRGHVTTHCVCSRCGARFSFEEDRAGKVVKR